MKLSNKLKLHSLTIVLFLVGFLTGYIKYLLMIFIIVIVHELGHVIMAIIFKRKIESLTLLPFGGLLKMYSIQSTSIFEDLLISIGGILFQLLLAVALYLLHFNNLIEQNIFEFMNSYNKMIIAFNLIPICPLDGYKMTKLLMELLFPFKLTFKISFVLSSMILIFIISSNFNVVKDNIFIFTFLVISTIEEIKASFLIVQKFYLERILYDFKYPRKNISKKEDMYKNKINYINGIHEKKFLLKNRYQK